MPTREIEVVQVNSHLEKSAASVAVQPAISVIMSVYNCARYVAEAIESILAQSFKGFELIIVDDLSNDGSSEICQRFAVNDCRIRLLRNEQHLGLTRSLNKALSLATGKFIARMDADDSSLPERFEHQVQYLESNPQIGLVGSYYLEIDENGLVGTEVIQFSSDPIIVQWRMAIENPIPHPPIMMRKELIDQVGGYDERWQTSQDYDLFTRLSNTTKLANYPQVLFHWRRHNKSISSTETDQQRANAYQICRSFLSDLLKREVPMEIVHLLWNRKTVSADEAVSLCTVGLEVCRAVKSQSRWSRKERGLLRRYVSRKLFSYARPYLGSLEIWPCVVRLLMLSPWLFVDVITSKAASLFASRALRT